MSRALLISMLALAGGCKANGVSEPVDTAPEDSGREDTADTGTIPPPRCEIPESEPNDAPAEANDLPIEALACGDISKELDLDQWRFEVDHHGWIGIYAEAHALGSRADLAIAMLSDEGDSAVYYGDQGTCTGGKLPPCARDVHLLFPAAPSRYTLMLSEEDALGAEEEYHYELLVTAAKEPVSWTALEVEGNDRAADAQPIVGGERLFGGIADSFDTDWYRVDVPAGKHSLVMQIEGYTYGSAGDFQIVIWDRNVKRINARYWGEKGWEMDPYLVHTSTGGETLYVQVSEQRDRGGRAYWYVLDFALEGT